MILSRTITCRFYGGLNLFLAPERRRRLFSHTVKGVPSIKDTVEALGVPHTEIDCIVVNGGSVEFSYQIHGGERVLVYPDAAAVKLKKIIPLKPAPPVHPEFTADVHLGKLARHLRFLGFDTIYRKDMTDGEIIACSCPVGRVVLTRDIGLLKIFATFQVLLR